MQEVFTIRQTRAMEQYIRLGFANIDRSALLSTTACGQNKPFRH